MEATTKPRQAQESRPSLKIVIPKDASKPDGDAVENGALLCASELHARGHFVNSPSDAAPILANKTKDNDDDLKDKSYRPPKRSDALDNEAPESIYASDGEEITSETEHGRRAGVLKVLTHLQQSTKLFEGGDNYDGPTDEGLDTEWAV